MGGWSASAETPYLILGSGKRPDIRAKICDKGELFDVRTNTVTRDHGRLRLRDSSNRVLPVPAPGDAIPSNGIPPRPPPGKYRRRLPIPIPRSTRPSPTPTHCRLPITRANYALRANYERELTRELRGAPVSRLLKAHSTGISAVYRAYARCGY